MSNDISVTQRDIVLNLGGILTQLRASGIVSNNHCSLADALHDLNLWDYAFHQAEVNAVNFECIRRLSNIVNRNI